MAKEEHVKASDDKAQKAAAKAAAKSARAAAKKEKKLKKKQAAEEKLKNAPKKVKNKEKCESKSKKRAEAALANGEEAPEVKVKSSKKDKKRKKEEAAAEAAEAEEAPSPATEEKRPAKKSKKDDDHTAVDANGAAEYNDGYSSGGNGGNNTGGEGTGTASKAFQRVKADEWLGKKGSWDNSYVGTFGESGWGFKAQQILGQVRGKDFRHEKTKKKRGSYRGGIIDSGNICSFKFDSDDE